MQCTCITFLHRRKVVQGYGSACVCLFWQHGNILMSDEVPWCARAFQSGRAGVSILTMGLRADSVRWLSVRADAEPLTP